MLGIGSGAGRSGKVRKIVKNGLQAWYRCDTTQAPLGEEEVTNGDFSLGSELITNDGWTPDVGGVGSYDTSTQILTINNNSGGGGARQTGIDISAGDTFLCTFTIDAISGYGGGDGVYFRVEGTESATKRTTTGTYSEYITVANTSIDNRIDVKGDSGSGNTATISNISVKKTNPNDSWVSDTATGGTVTIKDGSVDIVTDGAGAGIQQVGVFTVGKKYEVIVDAAITSGAGVKVGSDNAYDNIIDIISATGIVTGTFVATHANFRIHREGSSAGNYTINSVSIKEITNSVRDHSSNNNNAVLYSGKALDFDGTGDYIQIADDPSLNVGTGDFTLAAWVYCDTLSTTQRIISKRDGTSGYTLYKEDDSSGNRLYLEVDDQGGEGMESYNFGSASALAVNTWYRIVVVADRDVAPRLYINGEFISAVATSTDANTWSSISSDSLDSTCDLFIGIDANGSSYPWFGMIADVQLYKKAWTASDATYDWGNPDKDVFDNEGRSENLDVEILPDPNFSTTTTINNGNSSTTDSSGFVLLSATGSTATISNNALTIANAADAHSDRGKLYLNDGTNSSANSFEVGKVYALEYVIEELSGVTAVKTLFNGGHYEQNLPSTVGKHKYIFTCTGTSGVIFRQPTQGATVKYSSISVKEVITQKAEISPTDCTALYRLNEGAGDRVYNAAPVLGVEEITNGGFNTDTSSWTGGSDATLTVESNQLKVALDGGDNFGNAYQSFAVVSGTIYEVTGTIVSKSNGAQIRVDETAAGDAPLVKLTDLGTTTKTFIASSTSTYYVQLRVQDAVGANAVFDNVSVKEITLSNSYAYAGDPAWATAQPYIPQYAMSSYSKKMIFDGSNDYVALGSKKTIAADEAFSLSFWFLANQVSSAEFVLGTDDSDSYIRINPATPDVVNIKMEVGGQIPIEFDADNAYSIGELNHIVITGAASGTGTLKLYLNGVLQADTGTRASNVFEYYYIGNYNEGGTPDRYEGFLDEFAHFSTELSATEVSEIFNGGMALDARDHSEASNLEGYWRNNGADRWDDLSTNDNHGTVNGSPTTIQLQEVPYFGKDSLGLPMNRVRQGGLNLDGASYAEISIDSSFDTSSTNKVSVEAWVKFFTPPGSGESQYIFSNEDFGTSATKGFRLIASNANYDFTTENGGSKLISASHSDSILWTHVVATYDESNYKIYVDGAKIGGDIASTTAMVAGTEVARIGADKGTADNFFNGIIDDVKFYNRDLTLAEVIKNRKKGLATHKSTSVWSDDFGGSFG